MKVLKVRLVRVIRGKKVLKEKKVRVIKVIRVKREKMVLHPRAIKEMVVIKVKRDKMVLTIQPRVTREKKVKEEHLRKENQVKVIKANQDHPRKVIKVTKVIKVNLVVEEELLEVISRFNSMIMDLLLVQMD